MRRLLFVAAALSILVPSAGIHGAVLTITVNDTTDSNSASAQNACINGLAGCTLRAAITVANANAGSTINVPAGTYTLTLAGASEHNNASGDLNPSATMTIVGAGSGTDPATATIIQAGTDTTNGIDGVFRTPFATLPSTGIDLTMSNLTVRHGRPLATFTSGNAAGGGISVDLKLGGRVTISNVLVDSNTTPDGNGGGIAVVSTGSGQHKGYVTLTNVTVSNNTASIGSSSGGSAVFGGGVYFGNSVSGTLTNVTITNNTVIAGGTKVAAGGGFDIEGQGVQDDGVTPRLTEIHGGLIQGNSVVEAKGSGDGGGIMAKGLFTLDGGTLITDNTAQRNGGGLYDNVNNGSTSVAHATFTGNTAGNLGGGVYVARTGSGNGHTKTLSYSRIVGNTIGGSSTTAGRDFYLAQNAMTVTRNWWGCNTDPTLDCNTAIAIGGTTFTRAGGVLTGKNGATTIATLTYGPWLRLTLASNPTSLSAIGETATLTGSFLADSGGGALTTSDIARLLNLPITFQNAVNGSLSGAQSTIQPSGTATVTFTATGAGTGSAAAVVDGAVAQVAIEIGTAVSAPTVTADPASQTVTVGTSASFASTASGTPTPTIQWQVSTDNGASWANISGAASSPYTFIAAQTDSGKLYRAVFTNVAGTAASTPATLTVQTPPSVTVDPASQTVTAGATASFTATASGTPTPTVQWQVSTDHGSTWSDVPGATGTTYSVVTVAGDNGKRFRATFQNAAGRASTTAAVLRVYGAMTLTRRELRFGVTKYSDSATLAAGTAPQAIGVRFSGMGSAWTATTSTPWLQVMSGSGTGSGQFMVGVINPDNVIGSHSSLIGTVTVSAPTARTADGTPTSASSDAATITVTLDVDQTAATATGAPFGMVETPLQGATGVTGAIGITGWALDDVGVSSVKVYRNCLPFDNPAACQQLVGHRVVFMGDAAFVADARPDVEAAYPSLPAAHLAGWGYMALTNALPHVPHGVAWGGQGPLQLFAIATDAEGRQTLLGRTPADHTPTSITLANDTIAKPFGTIDTPGQGATVSGVVHNFGWALTPDSDAAAGDDDIVIPPGGATMVVYVDGMPIGTVAYNQCRGSVGNPVPDGAFCDDDVAGVFGNAVPQPAFTPRTSNPTRFRNLDASRAAIGAFSFDTRELSNGLHTIAWSVTDSAGRIEGIGSRNFTVLNAQADERRPNELRPSVTRTDRHVLTAADEPDPSQSAVGIEAGRVLARIGFDPAGPLEELPADAEGIRHVTVPEFGRLELRLGPVDVGHLMSNGEPRDLPAGSYFGPDAGIFAWAPAAGYIGTYRLIFHRGAAALVVEVTVTPATGAASGPADVRLHIDPPPDSDSASARWTSAVGRASR